MAARKPPHVRFGRFVRRVLRQVGLARPAPAGAEPGLRERRRAVFARLLGAYALMPDPAEPFDAWIGRRRAEEHSRSEATFAADMRRVLTDLAVPLADEADASEIAERLRTFLTDIALSAGQRRDVLARFVETVSEGDVTPRFYEFDRLYDLEEILASRYACGRPDLAPRAGLAADLVDALAGRESGEERNAAVRRLLGVTHPVLSHEVDELPPGFRETVGDVADDFAEVRVEADPDAFLAGNRAYSCNRREELGHADTREISLLREYEQDHLAMIRTILRLQRERALGPEDEILIVGSRYKDEIEFFREDLGLPRTIGLDLFEDPGWIVEGDMHAMPFEDRRFKLVYTCNTLSYSHYARAVVEEMARVTTRPGYVFIIDSGKRPRGPSPLARTDMVSAEAVRRMFHRQRFTTLVCDDGRSLDVDTYLNQPCVAVRLESRA